MIKLQVIGHLGKDCQVNNVNGKSVMNFTVAHSEKFRDASGNQKDKTTWVDCAYWSDRTAIAPYLKKGQLVYVEGSPEVRSYQTKDGSPGASLTVRVSNIQLLGGRQGGEQESNDQPQSAYRYNNNYNATPAAPSPTDITEPMDDLPF